MQLQLSESVPNLLEIGSNQEETKKLLQDHELLLSKLKVSHAIEITRNCWPCHILDMGTRTDGLIIVRRFRIVWSHWDLDLGDHS